MDRADLQELHYITLMSNVPSILEVGILSHVLANDVQHDSVAMEEIQERRRRVVVPQGRPLHKYANLYFTARNPMLFKRLSQREELCVLRVSPQVLDVPGVVITDQNASSDYVRFVPAPAGLEIVDKDLTFAERWSDPNEIQYYVKKSAKQAEVLIPDRVDPGLVTGAWVGSEGAEKSFEALAVGCEVAVNLYLFFQGGTS